MTNYLLAPTVSFLAVSFLAVSFLAAPEMTPRTSSSFIMRKSSPSILISVPEYLPKRMLSPSFSARGNSLPSSLFLPLPTEMTSPSCGLSLAESGMMMPPRVVPTSSTRRTRMRSCSGVNFVAILADPFNCSNEVAMPLVLITEYEWEQHRDALHQCMQKREGFHASLICYHARL